MNKTLKATLLAKMEGQRSLQEVLARREADINVRLSSVAGEVAGAKQQLGERGKLIEDMQDAMRAVLQSEARGSPCPSSAGTVTATRCFDKEAAVVEDLRQQLAEETARRRRAEAIARQREQELA